MAGKNKVTKLTAAGALAIAKRHLPDLVTLERRRSDSLDFHEVSVWALQGMLSAAFEAGVKASGGEAPAETQAPSVTRDELIAVDSMMLEQIGALCKLGAQDLADQRRDLRLRVLGVLDQVVR